VASHPAARRLTEQFRRQQVQLSARTVQLLIPLWRLLDWSDPTRPGGVDEWLTSAHLVVERSHAASIRTAAAYFTAFRGVEFGVPWQGAVPAVALSLEGLATSLRTTGIAQVRQMLRTGHPLERALDSGMIASARAGSRWALSGGRDTMFNLVTRDDQCLGWARAGRLRPCAFCAMLISRGPVYKTRESALWRRGQEGDRYHDNCYCEPEPVYSVDQEWPAGSRRLHDLWQENKPRNLAEWQRIYEEAL